jgi:hypothetical protein
MAPRGTIVTTCGLMVGSFKLKDGLNANKYIVIVIILCYVGTISYQLTGAHMNKTYFTFDLPIPTAQ